MIIIESTVELRGRYTVGYGSGFVTTLVYSYIKLNSLIYKKNSYVVLCAETTTKTWKFPGKFIRASFEKYQ